MFRKLDLEHFEISIAKAHSHQLQVLYIERQSALTPCLAGENKLQDQVEVSHSKKQVTIDGH